MDVPPIENRVVFEKQEALDDKDNGNIGTVVRRRLPPPLFLSKYLPQYSLSVNRKSKPQTNEAADQRIKENKALPEKQPFIHALEKLKQTPPKVYSLAQRCLRNSGCGVM